MDQFEVLVQEVTKRVLALLENSSLSLSELSVKPTFFVAGSIDDVVKSFGQSQEVNLTSSLSEDYEAVVVSQLSLERLVRISKMLPEDEIERTILNALLSKMPVYVLEGNQAYKQYQTSGYYASQQYINECVDTWQRFGATLVVSDPETKLFKNHLLTKEDIDKLGYAGEKTITVEPDTIITPLAKDAIRENGLTVIYSRKEV